MASIEERMIVPAPRDVTVTSDLLVQVARRLYELGPDSLRETVEAHLTEEDWALESRRRMVEHAKGQAPGRS